MMSALSILWYFAIFLLIAGYFILDGFDLGVGVLYPFLGRSERDQKIMRRSIGPVWDGNEVWLLTAGGALFAAFPPAYATTFSGFYLAVMLVLFGLIVRAVSFEFWSADEKWRGLWNVCFFVGSLLPALLFGVAVGNIFAGIPMDVEGNYAGIPLIGLISPFTLLTGIMGLAMFTTAGACWLSAKAPTDSDVYRKARALRRPLQVVDAALFIALTIYVWAAYTPLFQPGMDVMCTIFVVLFAIGLIVSFAISGKTDLWAFLFQSLSTFSLVGLLACTMFPTLVNATPESIGQPITLMSASASDLSLTCMTIILCIGLPLVLVYHVIIYRTFRGRVVVS